MKCEPINKLTSINSGNNDGGNNDNVNNDSNNNSNISSTYYSMMSPQLFHIFKEGVEGEVGARRR